MYPVMHILMVLILHEILGRWVLVFDVLYFSHFTVFVNVCRGESYTSTSEFLLQTKKQTTSLIFTFTFACW